MEVYIDVFILAKHFVSSHEVCSQTCANDHHFEVPVSVFKI